MGTDSDSGNIPRENNVGPSRGETQFQYLTAELSKTRGELNTIRAELESKQSAIEASNLEIRMAEERYRAILDKALDAFVCISQNGVIIEWNPQAEITFGYSRDEIIGKQLYDIILPPQYRQEHRERLQQSAPRGEGPAKRIESTALHKDGHEFPIELTIIPITQKDENVLCYFIRDITGRRKAEEGLRASNVKLQQALSELREAQSQIVQQERLRAIGEMVSGIAHDFNNTLSPILGYSDLLLMSPENLADREKVRHGLEVIHTAAKDAAEVIRHLREFYRKRDPGESFSPVYLNPLIQQVISLTQPKWKDEAFMRGLALEVSAQLNGNPVISGNEHELREVLLNLILNAVDAMYKDGSIRISSGTNGDRVSLVVADQGSGMTDQVMEHCFEPFFTTKGEHGTGLGLSMVFGIVKRHGGDIEIKSRPWEGTSIHITLPALTPFIAISEAQGVSSFHALKILIVDDEPKVREIVKEYLMADGHQVQEAGDGEEALALLQNGWFDLVITDRGMPNINGDALALMIKHLAPDKPVIMLTGFGDIMTLLGEIPPGVDLIISKPVGLKVFREVISKVMRKPLPGVGERSG